MRFSLSNPPVGENNGRLEAATTSVQVSTLQRNSERPREPTMAAALAAMLSAVGESSLISRPEPIAVEVGVLPS
jgi:hypothetical protein